MKRPALIVVVAVFGLLAGARMNPAEESGKKRETQPMLYLLLGSDVQTIPELTEFADTVRDRLERVSGVEEVTLIGGRRYALRIRPDTERLAAYGILPRQLDEELSHLNLKLTRPRIGSEEREMKLPSRQELASPEDLGNIIVAKGPGGTFIRLKDVAVIEIGMETETLMVSYQDKRVVALGVIKQKRVHPLMFSAILTAALPPIQAMLPAGMWIEIAHPSSLSIEPSVPPDRMPPPS